jgi:hypothetical protein
MNAREDALLIEYAYNKQLCFRVFIRQFVGPTLQKFITGVTGVTCCEPALA